MNKEELERLEHGKKLLGEINKLKVQLKALDNCDQVNIYGSDKNDETNRTIIRFDFTNDHPFYVQALSFIADFRHYLQNKIIEKESEFDSL